MRIALRTKVLVGVAALIGGYLIFWPADSTPVETAKSVERAAAAPRAHAAVTAETRGEGAARALYLFAHRVADATAASSLFAAHSWYVPPPPPPAAPVNTAPVAPPQPVAPPLPYQFIGSYTPDGQAAVIFLTNGDRVYDVHVGDTLDNIYSVDSFDNGQLTFTYKPLNTKQQLAAGIVP
jgi:hypothetical protein